MISEIPSSWTLIDEYYLKKQRSNQTGSSFELMDVGPVAITHPDTMSGMYQQIDYSPNVEGLLEEMILTKLSLGLLVFQEHSFPSLSSLVIDQCPYLHTILIENDVMNPNMDESDTSKDSYFLIHDCHKLEVLTIGRRSCCSVNRFEIMSMFL